MFIRESFRTTRRP